DADRTRRAGLQQLDLDRADPAADLEHGPAFDALLLQEVDDPARRGVEALAPVSLRIRTGAALAENPAVALGRAAITQLDPAAPPEQHELDHGRDDHGADADRERGVGRLENLREIHEVH